MGIGAKIKEYRTKAGFTQKDLADKLYVTYQAVSRWENDEVEPSIDTIKQICSILKCSTDDLFDVKKEEKPKKEKEPVKVVEKVIVKEPKVILGICEKCGKPIDDPEDLKKHEVKVRVGAGRAHHYETKNVVLCNKCDLERLVDERMEEERQAKLKAEGRKKRRIHSFVWPALLSLTYLIIAITGFSKGNTSLGVYFIIFSILGYTWLATLILNNTFLTDLWMSVASWGFVKMPGVIFSFGLDGIIFLITVKLFLFLLGLTLALLSFAFATGLTMMLSVFVYPYALKKNIKGIE